MIDTNVADDDDFPWIFDCPVPIFELRRFICGGLVTMLCACIGLVGFAFVFVTKCYGSKYASKKNIAFLQTLDLIGRPRPPVVGSVQHVPHVPAAQ